MHQLGRETNRVRGHRRQSALVHGTGAGIGHAHPKAQAAEKSGPEGHGLPEKEHPGQADGDGTVWSQLGMGIGLKEQLLPFPEQIGYRLGLANLGLQLLLYSGVLGIAQHCAPFTAVVGDPGIAVGEGQNGAFAVVLTEIEPKQKITKNSS